MKFLIGLVSFLITMLQLASISLAAYIAYYIYEYGLEQLFNAIWKGF